MEELVVLTKLEEEYVLRALESALHVRNLRQLFLWAQGELQSLLPHAILVCMHFDEDDAVRRIECLHNNSQSAEVIKQVCSAEDGLALRLAQRCREHHALPCAFNPARQDPRHPQLAIQAELIRYRLGNFLAHGTERVCGGATFFAMFSLPQAPTGRQAFLIELMLPCLHLAFQRVTASAGKKAQAPVDHLAQPLTAREVEILRWVTKGKNKGEIGEILGISPVTVKNHMHKIYKKLNVGNRVQAILRCHSLRLLDHGDSRGGSR